MHSMTLEAAHLLLAAAEAERDQWRAACAALAAAYLADAAPAPLSRRDVAAVLADSAPLRRLISGGYYVPDFEGLVDAVMGLVAYRTMAAEPPPAMDAAALAAAQRQALGLLNLEEGE